MKLMDRAFKPALALMTGRALGFAGTFLIPVVLVRVFSQAEFGTYKQLLLIHASLYVVAQFGMAESLFYFLPRNPRPGGRYVANSLVFAAASGLACVGVLQAAGPAIAQWLKNPALAEHMTLLSLFLGLTVASALLEMVLISRNRYGAAGVSYGVSDLLRALFFITPALLARSLEGMLVGAVAFAAIRLAAALAYLRREFGDGLRPDASALKAQLVYALPFAAAVVVEMIQGTFHQYAVSYAFDPAAFAIYAVGCLSIPVVDFVAGPVGNVMMVRMGEALREGRPDQVTALWHDTTRRLALLFIPMVGLTIVTARELFLILFTANYLASVPIFVIWSMGTLGLVLVTDGVLRVYADTRFLFALNLVKLALNVALMGWFIGLFQLQGAVLVTVLATALAKALALARMSRLMGLGLRQILPWRSLGVITASAALAALAALSIKVHLALSPVPLLVATGLAFAATHGALLWALRLLGRQEQLVLPAWMGGAVHE
jgi:O-antigen/teichoic acid export membrane protein